MTKRSGYAGFAGPVIQHILFHLSPGHHTRSKPCDADHNNGYDACGGRGLTGGDPDIALAHSLVQQRRRDDAHRSASLVEACKAETQVNKLTYMQLALSAKGLRSAGGSQLTMCRSAARLLTPSPVHC